VDGEVGGSAGKRGLSSGPFAALRMTTSDPLTRLPAYPLTRLPAHPPAARFPDGSS
jgi:hypothetical protein